LIGNDVVDLRDAGAQAGARHPRFDERIFAPEERATLAADDCPDRLRWIFWAAKEAAYKVARKRDRACVFSPVRFVVKLSASSEGVVELGAARFPVRVMASSGVVHAVATDAAFSDARLCMGVRELPPEALLDPAAPGRAARELAVSHLRSRCAEGGALRVARDGRIPVLEVDGERSAADLSLSHHGRWVAFACQLPERGELSA